MKPKFSIVTRDYLICVALRIIILLVQWNINIINLFRSFHSPRYKLNTISSTRKQIYFRFPWQKERLLAYPNNITVVVREYGQLKSFKSKFYSQMSCKCRRVTWIFNQQKEKGFKPSCYLDTTELYHSRICFCQILDISYPKNHLAANFKSIWKYWLE